MFDKLIRMLDPGSSEPAPENAGPLAVAALLVAAARADGQYDPEEAARIDRVLVRRYGIGPFEAGALRAEAEHAEGDASDLVRFTRAVKEAVPHEDRVSVIEALWEVIYADGARSYEESALVRRLCGLLYVEDRDAGLARQRVARRLGIE